MKRRRTGRNSTIVITPAAFTSPNYWVLLRLSARSVVELGSAVGFEMKDVANNNSSSRCRDASSTRRARMS
jgi:hypothetical protein